MAHATIKLAHAPSVFSSRVIVVWDRCTILFCFYPFLPSSITRRLSCSLSLYLSVSLASYPSSLSLPTTNGGHVSPARNKGLVTINELAAGRVHISIHCVAWGVHTRCEIRGVRARVNVPSCVNSLTAISTVLSLSLSSPPSPKIRSQNEVYHVHHCSVTCRYVWTNFLNQFLISLFFIIEFETRVSLAVTAQSTGISADQIRFHNFSSLHRCWFTLFFTQYMFS